MISTGGSEFRTLVQPIFVNGKKVREVWANGRMVYPEAGIGNFVKVRGVLAISKSFTRPQSGAMFKDTVTGYLIEGSSTYMPEWNSYFAVKVVFVAIYKYGGSNIEIVDDWIPLTTSRYEGGYYTTRLNPLSPGMDEEFDAIDRTYGKRITSRFDLVDFRCQVLYDGIPIPPVFVEEFKSGGLIIYDSPDAYARIDTVPDTPSVLAATMWNSETFTEMNHSYPNPLYPEASLRIYQHESGGIVLAMSGLTVPATKIYYSGSYFLEGYYGLWKTERITLKISEVGVLQVPITEILYQGAESEAPDWAKTITDRDLDV